MADRIAENADLVVDDMKRKARRRLVGAIVLALAAAVILPMLLEKEPRPLGDDVSVKIPPVDEGKFINRLTGKSGESKGLPKAEDKGESKGPAAKSDPRPEPMPPSPPALPAASAPSGIPAASESVAPKKSVAEAEQRVLAPPSKVPVKPDGDASSAPEARIESKAVTTEVRPAAADPKPATGNSPTPAQLPVPAAAKAEGFVVQLAAFADDKGANALANKLKRAGYAAFVEPVQTSHGTLWRVRVGGYGSKPDAEAARVKLKGEGFSGIVAPAS
jgi:DedD protein